MSNKKTSSKELSDALTRDDKKVNAKGAKSPEKKIDVAGGKGVAKPLNEKEKLEKEFKDKEKELKTLVETLTKQLKEAEHKISKVEEKQKKEMEQKNSELATLSSELGTKEKGMITLSQTNKKLLIALEDLRKKVDTQMDKINITKVNEKVRESHSESKATLENSLKVKEVELRNAYSLIDILKKDLSKKERIMEHSEYFNAYHDSLNKIKYEEQKNQELNHEIRLQKKFGEDHKKCKEKQSIQEKEKKQLLEELKIAREKHKELMKLYTEEQRKNTAQHKQIVDDTHPKSLTAKNKQYHAKNVSYSIERSKNTGFNASMDTINSQEEKKFRKEQRSSSYRRNNLNLYSRGAAQVNEKETKLFSEDQKKKIEEVLGSDEVESLEKKYSLAVTQKAIFDHKLKTESKIMAKQMIELQEQLEFVNLQLKESEQKNKIFYHQLNEKSLDFKLNSKKLHEYELNSEEWSKKLESINKLLKEKTIEANNSKRQLTLLKKIVKNNNVTSEIAGDKDHNISVNFMESEIAGLENQEINMDLNEKEERKDSIAEDIEKALENNHEHQDKDPSKAEEILKSNPSKHSGVENERNVKQKGKEKLDEKYKIKPQKNKGIDV